ncbi:hypothetical protein [Streptomyces griseus]|uniref:hypothetical protein n=1 Tax=Streptomyces griseus TaxID=1911 RepID=UPI0033AB4B27
MQRPRYLPEKVWIDDDRALSPRDVCPDTGLARPVSLLRAEAGRVLAVPSRFGRCQWSLAD